jgi:hypothetical protein
MNENTTLSFPRSLQRVVRWLIDIVPMSLAKVSAGSGWPLTSGIISRSDWTTNVARSLVLEFATPLALCHLIGDENHNASREDEPPNETKPTNSEIA